jgi:Flp pilus assembly protein TadG
MLMHRILALNPVRRLRCSSKAILTRFLAGISSNIIILHHFITSKCAASAVEFSLIAPVLLILFFAAIDISRAVTAAYRAGFVADTIGELVSQADHTLTDSELTSFIQLAPLIDPDILAHGRHIKSTNLKSLANVAISSIAMSKLNASCTSGCTYSGSVVFSRALSGPTRPCGLQTASANDAAISMTALPTSVFGPVDIVVVDITVFFKPFLISAALMPDQFIRSAYFRPRILSRISSQNNCAGF